MLTLPNKFMVVLLHVAQQLIIYRGMFQAEQIVTPPDYCASSLCNIFNGSHVLQLPNIACENNGTFGEICGPLPKLLYMSARRRQFLLDMHNLVRNRIAGGNLSGYESASNMPVLRWDAELEAMAVLHAKRCQLVHDDCRNTPRFKISGQNIGYLWIGRKFKSHSRRIKSFVINWFREHNDANQSFIDSYHRHPSGKKIGHFTMLVGDRVHRVGCAAVKFLDATVNKFQFLLTCNYDYDNIYSESIYQSGQAASKCTNGTSKMYPALCDWKIVCDNTKSDGNIEDANLMYNKIPGQ